MRTLALSILTVLAIGLAVLLWTATGAVLAPLDPTERAEVTAAPSSTPAGVRRPRTALEAQAPAVAVPSDARPAAPPAPLEPSAGGAPDALRDDAVVPVQAYVHGTARAAPDEVATEENAPPPAVRPVPGVHLRFKSGERVVHEVDVGRDGHFEARFLVAGPCTLEIGAPQGWKPSTTPLALDLPTLTGKRPLPLRFARTAVEIAGDVRGFLASESGAWTAETLPKRGAVLLDLVAVDDPFLHFSAEVTHGVDAHGAPTVEFGFADVPRGEYELTLSALDSFRWHPKSLRVTPPAAGLSFLRYDKERSLPLVFRVFDARTRETIETFEVRRLQVTPSQENGVFLHTGPIALGTFAVEGPFQWSLWADDHAPAFGDETSFVEKDGARVAEVLLQRGWGTKVFALARDPTARAYAGAEVWLDGRLAGRTGKDGMLVLAAEEAPRKLEIKAAGLVLAGDPLAGHDGRRAEGRGHVTLAFLEPRR